MTVAPATSVPTTYRLPTRVPPDKSGNLNTGENPTTRKSWVDVAAEKRISLEPRVQNDLRAAGKVRIDFTEEEL
ncbi:hypothetical protein M5689_011027 [Euphorbia peplus]|nr:hypothetical protein M5689_011027 [Euphorbia peplus]